MRSKLVAIGNSKGVRLPKAILQTVGLEDAVELHVAPGKLTITPARRPRRRPRAGWAQAIRAEVARNGPPPVLDTTNAPLSADWDNEEWQW